LGITVVEVNNLDKTISLLGQALGERNAEDTSIETRRGKALASMAR
jgi:hypothetical protein